LPRHGIAVSSRRRSEGITAMATATSATDSPIPPAKLAHVVFQTPAIAPLRDWYGTVFGARVVHQNPMLCFMTFDEEHHRIALIQRPEIAAAGEAPRAGLHHIAFSYDGIGDLLRTYARLKALGIQPFWCVHHGISVSMYYRDPDGNQVELQVDALATPAEAQAYIDANFPSNPIGVTFDPDALLARHQAGAPVASLLRQSEMPRDGTLERVPG